MVANLVTIGDSWPAGAELKNPKLLSFPALIGERLHIKSINLAVPATSADQALYTLINASLPICNNTLVLFCLTGISRSMNIKDDRPKEIHPTSNTPASKAYYKFIHSNQLDKFNRIRNILAAQHFCQKVGCKILFVNNWDQTPRHHAVDESLFYTKTLTEILNLKHDDSEFDNNMSKHEYITPNLCHPNVNGHSIIAEELSNWIKEKLNEPV
jgi:hypothetical protein